LPTDALVSMAAQAGSSTIPPLRLVASESDLHLVDGERIWKWELADGEVVEGSMWTAVDLEGVDLEENELEEDAQSEESVGKPGRLLPHRIRNFLPAEGDSEFEFLTVYGAQLDIYRRGAEEEAFEKLASLDAVDRDLRRNPYDGTLFLTTSSGIHRSEDEGETWEKMKIATGQVISESLGQLDFIENESVESGYTIWVSGTSGSSWRSDDGTQTWEAIRERDLDDRAVTGIARQKIGETLWMSTAGQGMWRSFDQGATWQEANENLHAGQTFDAAVTEDGRILVGTDAGLFERSEGDGEVQWRSLHSRATSAIYIHPDNGRIISGTLGGSIVVRTPSGEQHTSEAAPLGRDEEMHFESPHLGSAGLAPSAVVHLTRRPGTQDIIAWSHQQGPLISNDGGASWRRMRLGTAFRNALAGSVVTHFVSNQDNSYFAITRSQTPNQPTQLWRSTDGGETWQATYSFMNGDEETSMRLVRIPNSGQLVMSHGSRVAVSDDQGETWSQISGPWQRGGVTGMGLDDQQVVVVTDLAHTSEIVWLSDPIGDQEISSRHRVIWPQNWRLFADRPVGMAVEGDQVLLKDSEIIYNGLIPRRQTRLPGSIAILVTIFGIFSLSGISFAYLRTWGDR
jgi:photosystem II stability/assembly factor-like uncharacterized protein